jgi:Arc/MetJ-type ribon-helix-helix transcriptional regulator
LVASSITGILGKTPGFVKPFLGTFPGLPKSILHLRKKPARRFAGGRAQFFQGTLPDDGGHFGNVREIAKDGYHVVCCLAMKTQSLNVDLTPALRRYLKDQVRAGRYQNENEVVSDAIRQMQLREIEQFERIFGDYPGAPQNEPTTEDDEAIKAAIYRHRAAKNASQAA